MVLPPVERSEGRGRLKDAIESASLSGGLSIDIVKSSAESDSGF